MSLDLARANIAVISNQAYRAQSIALALGEISGGNARAFTKPDNTLLAGFETVLLEIDAGLDSSLDRVREIIGRHPDIKVVLLGLVESEESVLKMAEAGASGYAGPATTLQELIAILRSVHKGEFQCPPHITYALFSHLTNLAGSRAVESPSAPILTLRERKIVKLLSHHFTNKEIAAQLCISQYTAKNHVQRILKKLGLHDRSLASQWPVGLPARISTGEKAISK